MKTINEVKNGVAERHGFGNFIGALSRFQEGKITYPEIISIINEAMQEHAKQMCDLQIKACAENAEAVEGFNIGFSGSAASVDKESILSTPNVAEKP